MSLLEIKNVKKSFEGTPEEVFGSSNERMKEFLGKFGEN